jgi:hypothetical protein
LARLWWLDNQPDNLLELAEKTNKFESIAALFRPSAEQPSADPVPGLVKAFLDGLSTDQRAQLVDQLGLVFRAYERTDLADELHSNRPVPAWRTGPDDETPNGRDPIPRAP